MEKNNKNLKTRDNKNDSENIIKDNRNLKQVKNIDGAKPRKENQKKYQNIYKINKNEKLIKPVFINDKLVLRNLNTTKEMPRMIKKNESPKRLSSMKFPMPRNYKPNNFVERNLSSLELQKEMVKMYDQKIISEDYDNFITQTLNYKNQFQEVKKKEKSKKTLKKLKNQGKRTKTQQTESIQKNIKNETAEETEELIQKFEEIENFHFKLDKKVKYAEREFNFLPYINININVENETREIIALKDSGASHSLLDIKELKKFNNSKNLNIKSRKLRMITPNATTENAIRGEVELELFLKCIDGEILTLKHTFLLADLGEKQKCIIGYDFLGNDKRILGETPKHLFIKEKEKNYAIEIYKRNGSHNKANPKAVSKNSSLIAAHTTQCIELVCESEFTEITSLDQKDCIFQAKDLCSDIQTYGLTMEPTLTTPKKTNNREIEFLTLVTNNTDREIKIRKNTELGCLEEMYEKTDIEVSGEDFKTLAHHILITQDEKQTKKVKIFESDELGIFSVEINDQEAEINSMFNRNEDLEEETELPDGSIRTQLITSIEDMLESDTYFSPEELLDKEEELHIQMANFKSVPEDIKDDLMKIVQEEMKEVWSRHKWDIGLTQKVKHDIETEVGVIVRDKQRQIPYHRNEYAKKAVNTLMKYNLVKPAYNSKWATNLVLVQKPTEGNFRDLTKASKIHNNHMNTKSTWRLTQDLRRVNEATKNIYTSVLPIIDEIVRKCRNKVVTQFDINQAYFIIELTEDSKEKTTFYMNDEVYFWNRMTQGLAGAPHTWMKFMKLIFCDETLNEYKKVFPERGEKIKEKHWHDFLSIYMDDLDVFSDTVKENLNHIHAVLWILKREGCLLNPKKAKFMTTNFTTLGVNINTKENLVSIDKKKAQAILSWPKPSSLLEVMSRLQSLNYISKNLPRLKEISYPLQ